MKIALWVVAALALFIAWYAVAGRAWFKSRLWAKPFFDWIEPIEIALWKKSETILFARFKMLVGVLLTVLTQLGTIDLTPLMPFVPDQYEGLVKLAFNLLPLTLTVLGMMDEKLRYATTKPVELVAVPEAAPVPIEVEMALARAESIKEEAVAVVEQAKQEGAV